MNSYVSFLLLPFLSCLALVGILAYFGLHVIKRGIIFVDLSLAQVAALGMTLSILLGNDLDDNATYFLSLGFALIGAALFTYTRGIKSEIPQEAIIGIVYAVSTAASIMMVSHSPEGAEHIQHLLVGSVLTVTLDSTLKAAGLFAIIGLFHFIKRVKFLELSFKQNTNNQYSKPWEFLFYASFAVAVTSAVKICGVLMVFVFLVVPSVYAALVTNRGVMSRLLHGWLFGIIGSAGGLVLSFQLDTPTGATIVCTFGAMLLLFGCYKILFKSAAPDTN
ncbi:MAG: metal ABC transporter permease [Candidatus Zixiibacteriota bacterium]